MAGLPFLNGSPSPKKTRTSGSSYSATSRGQDEVPYKPSDYIPGDNPKSSARPRVSVKGTMIYGCFCNKRGQ